MEKLRKYSQYLIFLIGLLLLTAPYILSQYGLYVLQRGMQTSIVVLGLVMLTGFSGMLSLASAALMAVGGYSYYILLKYIAISPWLAVILSIVITVVIGTLLAFPSFRLSGAFLTVTTIGFAEIIRILILNLEPITGGAYGTSDFPRFVANTSHLQILMTITIVFLAIAVRRIGDSRIGLAFKAIRQDLIAAEVMGVDVKRAKTVVYALYSLFAGISGVFFATLTGYLSPDSFTTAESITPLLMVVMGMNSPVGAILSALGLTWLPEVLRFLLTSRLMVFSLILLVYIRLSSVKPKWLIQLNNMIDTKILKKNTESI